MTLDFDFILLNLLLLLIFYLSGLEIIKGGNFRGYALLCILVFTFVMGSRYDRGPDYLEYVELFKKQQMYHGQWGFHILNSLIHGIGVEPYHIFYVYAFICISCSLKFLKRYRQYSHIMFPLFYVAAWWIFQNPVRQGISMSIAFLCLDQVARIKAGSIKEFFSRNNYVVLCKSFLYLIVAGSIHSANIFIVAMFIALYFLLSKPVPIIISWPLVVLFTYVVPNVYDYSLIEGIMMFIGSQSEVTNSYVSDQSYRLTADAFRDEFVISPVIQVFELMGNISLMYFAPKVIKLLYEGRKDIVTIFNIYVIGALIMSAFKLLEMFARVGQFTLFFYFLPLTLVIYHRKKIVNRWWEKALSLFLTFWFYNFFKYLFMNSNTLFLWDLNVL